MADDCPPHSKAEKSWTENGKSFVAIVCTKCGNTFNAYEVPTPTPVPAASERLDRFTDAIVEDILKAPDEEVLCDAILDIVARLRAENAVQADTITQLRADKLQLMQALARFTGGA